MASNLIGNLAVNLTMNTAAFQKGATIAEKRAAALQGKMNGIGNSIKGIGVGLATGFAAIGAGQLINNAFQIASSMQEAAAATGVTIEQLQRLRVAATQNGASADQMDASLTKLSAKLGELQQGSPQAVAAFDAIGLSVDQLKGKNPAEAFALIVEKISAIKDPTLQAALAKDILGKSYGQLLPLIKAGTAALNEATEASKRNGEITTEDAKRLDELADGWDMLKTRVGVGIAKIIAKFSEWSSKFDSFFAPINKFAADFDAKIYDMYLSAGKWFKGLHDKAYKWLVSGLSNIADRASAQIDKVTNKFFEMYDKVVGNSYVPDMVIGVNQWFAKMESGMVGSAGRATQSVTEKMALMQSNVAGILSRLFPEITAVRDIEKQIDDLSNAFKAGLVPVDVYRAALSKLTIELSDAKDAASELKQAMTPVNDNPTLEDLGIDIQGQINANLPRLSKDPGKTFEDFLGTVQNVAAEVANSMQDMQNAISGFAQSIKKGDVIGIIGGLANVIGIGLDIFSKIKGLPSSAPGRARGGNTTSNRSYIVGESGPELFSSSKSGYITSNRDMQRGSGRQNIRIVPSKYFDVVVDGRVAAVAQPMAAQAAALGSSSAQVSLIRRSNRRLE